MPVHGGPDALGVPLHDFSTNANACGPCPVALTALRQAGHRHYPDPAYTALRALLAQWHGVAPGRVVIAASASEFIHRITAHAARSGLRHARLPAHGYGDYARAARNWGLAGATAPGTTPGTEPALHWACEPSSPLGQADAALAAWAQALGSGALRVLDCAYAPLRLDGLATALPEGVWQLWSPNKALGLTGVRAAYAIAPPVAVVDGSVAALQALAPSWPLGADGVALLTAWVGADAQAWLAQSLVTLREWKSAQMQLCADLGWAVLPGSLANFFTARLPGCDLDAALPALRAQGIKLRDCASFGLPGHVRLGVL
ncbi:MAG: aminotransferase, partial [Proteobacteria bacterium]|nr:aminotransferase [Pseudomonadota bacterium]